MVTEITIYLGIIMPILPDVRNRLSFAPDRRTITSTRPDQNSIFSGSTVGLSDAATVINSAVLSSLGTPVVQYPTDLPKYFMQILELEPGIGTLNPNLSLEKVYRLQLPSTLTDVNEVQYDHNFNWFDLLSTFGRLGNQTFSAATGLTVNTLKAVTLRAPEFRTYGFEWKFAPKSPADAAAIRQVYYGIKKGMTPDGVGVVAGLVPAFQFPKIYWLAFYPNSEWLFKFKPAVVTRCEIDYLGHNQAPAFYKSATGSFGSTSGGPPESIVMRLGFLEMEYWIRRDYKDDVPTNNPYDVRNYYGIRGLDGLEPIGLRTSSSAFANTTPIPPEAF